MTKIEANALANKCLLICGTVGTLIALCIKFL